MKKKNRCHVVDQPNDALDVISNFKCQFTQYLIQDLGGCGYATPGVSKPGSEGHNPAWLYKRTLVLHRSYIGPLKYASKKIIKRSHLAAFPFQPLA